MLPELKQDQLNTASTRYSMWAAWFIGAVIILSSLVFHLGNPEPVNIITWDVYGYYAYLPASITYGDVHQYSFTDEHFENYNISQNLFQIAQVDEKYKAPIYTIGMAIIWFPAYMFATLVASLSSSYANDGLSPPFQWAVVFSSWVFVLLGLYYLRKTLLSIVSDKVTSITLLVVFLATNYFHYAVFEPGMSHSYIFSLYAALLYFTIQWHKHPQFLNTISIGVCIAMLCMVRPSEVIAILIPLFFGVVGGQSFTSKVSLLIRNWLQVIMLLVTGVSIVLVQFLYWKWSADVWYYNGYAAEHHFDWLSPHVYDGFFSYRKGWLLYTPVMALSVLGLIGLFISSNKLNMSKWKTSVLMYFLFNIYIVFSWHIWWYASSFGSRALVQSYAVMAIPLALVLSWCLKRKLLATLVGVFAFACFGLNHFQDWQYRNRILTFDNMTRSFYWNAWGSTIFDPNAFFLIDNDEFLTNRSAYSADPLLGFYAKSDTMKVLTKVEKAGLLAIQQTPANEYAATQRHVIVDAADADRLAGKWIEVDAKFMMSSTGFDDYNLAKLVLSISRGEENLLWRGVNIQRYRAANEWFDVRYQLQLPQGLQPGDTFTFMNWNTSPDTLYIHKMEVSLLSEMR